MERHQVALYVAALLVGATAGLALPSVAHPAELAISPVLGLLLYATFLGVPFARIGQALRDWRFLAAVMAVNFLLVPVVVWPLSRIVAHDRVLLVGVLFVLLTPCVDYVIVFTGIAGDAKDRLLAAAPLLMLAQMLLLPLDLWVFVGPEFVDSVDLAPFVEALALLILLPLAAAGLTQLAARTRVGRAWEQIVLWAMVPLMMLTLAVVVASQIAGVGRRVGSLLLAVPVYLLFAASWCPSACSPAGSPGSTSLGSGPSCSAGRPATRWSCCPWCSRSRPRSTSPRSSSWPRRWSSWSSWSSSSRSSRG